MPLESAEAAFDPNTLRIALLVVSVSVFAGAFGRDARLHFSGSNDGVNLVGVLPLVGNHGLGSLSCQQRRGPLAVGLFTTGSPQSLRPLFPVAACWWALTSVESIIT